MDKSTAFAGAERIIIGAPRDKKEPVRKYAGRLISPKNGGDYFSFEYLNGAKMLRERVEFKDLYSYVSEKFGRYKQADAFYRDGSHSLVFPEGGGLKFVRTKEKTAPGRDSSHNRRKNYILNEGDDIPVFIELGIFTKERKIVNSMYPKFKQINRFIELVADACNKKYGGSIENMPLKIIDFGCGKSYLTFVLYHYFKTVRGADAAVIGVDLKRDVVDTCNSLAARYGYGGLKFETGDIAGYKPAFSPDIVVSLHGCDTATDYAIKNAVDWGADIIFAVPCCEHELNGQLKGAAMPLLLKHGAVKERFAALLTNSLRAAVLEAEGYKTEVMEFVDITHTPKNLLIRAVKGAKNPARRAELLRAAEETCELFGVKQTIFSINN